MIRLHIPSLPPSSNHAYVTVRGMRLLSTEGKRYKKETTAWLTQQFPGELAKLKPNEPSWAAYVLTTPDLYTKGWPAKAANRYRKFDASNRIKLLEDVIAEVTGIDDSNNMAVLAMKREGPKERTDIYIWSGNEDTSEGINPFVEMSNTHTFHTDV